MNTPSKEALEAAKELFPDAISFYRFVAENAAEIIDRHFAPLRRRAEKAEARVKELKTLLASEKTTRNAIIAKGVATERANVELAGALRDARASFLGLQPDFGGPVAAQMGKAIERIGAALSRHASGEPAKHPDTEGKK